MSNKMHITHTYTKIRKNFGRQPLFCEVPSQMLDSIYPDKLEQSKYCLRNPVHTEIQNSRPQNEQYINTKTVTLVEQGVNHAEGGWPKDISFADEEATSRYRRRFERDDSYVDAVLDTYPKFNHYLKQNNAIEMYNLYFKTIPALEPVENFTLITKNVYNDEFTREIASISWTIEDDPKLVVAYCNKKYPIKGPVNESLSCSVWDLEIPSQPRFLFMPPSACWQAICSPVSPFIILGGLEDGRVCIFDIRQQQEPTALSPMHLAHRDPVSALLYMPSRLNTDFFSGSTDGQCMWWDVRNLLTPTDTLDICIRVPPGEHANMANSEGVNVLQFEKSFPTKFMCGTDTGFIVNVNRKAKSVKEMMCTVYNAHYGPVKALQRSPCSTKFFISCGDWTVHIWCDDIHTSPIITGISQRYKINDVAWAPYRVSCYMSVSADGKFRYWDLLRKTRAPTMNFQVSKNALLKVKPHDEGKLVAIGDVKGSVYILSLSESMALSGPMDKQLMTQAFERETRREHILEARIKEIRLKLAKANEETVAYEIVEGEDAAVRTAEENYKKIVSDELRLTGHYTAGPPTTGLRKR